MSRSVIRRRSVLLAVAASAACVAGALLPTTAGHADPSMTITSISPGYIGFPTYAEVDISGTGLSTDDTITSQPAGITFSQVTSDGHGGIEAVATTTSDGPSARDGITVTAPGGEQASCTKCLIESNGINQPTITSITPTSDSLTLDWTDNDFQTGGDSFIVTWSPLVGGPTLMAVPTATATINDLTAGATYVITVATINSAGDVGPDTSFTERVGAVPAAPTVTPRSVCCYNVEADAADAQSWFEPVPNNWLWTWTPVSGGPTTVRDTGGSFLATGTVTDRRGYRVTATLTNEFGTSPPSAPVIIKPIVAASPVTAATWQYSGHQLTLSWASPRNDGGAPVTQYLVDVTWAGRPIDAALASTARKFTVNLPPRQTFDATITPVTEAGDGEIASRDISGMTGPHAILTSLAADGRARWRRDTQGAWHGLGGHFTRPPTPVLVYPHRLFFVDTSHGHAVVRSQSVRWRPLTSIPCRDVAVNTSAEGNGLEATCLSGKDSLYLAHTAKNYRTGVPARIGRLPHIPRSAWTPLTAHSTGGLSNAAVGWTGFRVKPFDAHHDNVQAFVDPYVVGHTTATFEQIPLACNGPVVTSGESHPLFACKTGPHTVSWYSTSSLHFPGRSGAITVPWRFAADFGLTGDDRRSDGYLITTDTHGVIHEQDLHQSISWTLGHSAPSGTAAVLDS